ncbi:MAG: hypothetical protein ACQKBT_02360, partial [Puniceicoccales bacterium]
MLSGGAPVEDWMQAEFALSMSGELGVLSTLAPSEVEVPSAELQGDWKGSLGETISLEGGLSLAQLHLNSMPEADVDVNLSEFSFAQSEPMTVSGMVDLKWSAGEHSSSASGLSLAGVQQDNGRWQIAVEKGILVVDLLAFAADEDAMESAVPSSDFGALPALPHPSDFAVIRDLPALPLDVREVNLDGRWVLPEGDRKFQLSLANLNPSTEGTFVAEVEAVPGAEGASAIGGSLVGDVRLNDEGALSRLKAKATVTGVPVGDEVTQLFGDFTFTPGSPVDPLLLSLRTSEKGVELLGGRVSLSEDQMNLSLEADFANWLKSPFRALLPNLATGHLQLEVSLTDAGFDGQAIINALTPLDGFESYDLELGGQLTSLTPLSSEGELILTDAKDKKSDLKLAAGGDLRRSIKVDLTGSRVDLEALQGFGRVWSRPDNSALAADDAPTPPQTGEPSESDSWPLDALPFEVDANLSIGEFLPVGLPAVRVLSGSLFANTEKATVRMSADWMKGSSLSMEGRLARINGGAAASVDAKVVQLPLGDFLKEVKPQETPSIEGVATVGASFEGKADSLEDLPNWMFGTLAVDVRDGVIRSLKPEARVTKFVNAGSVAGAILGSSLNRPGVVALGKVTNLFKEIPFSVLTAKLERTKDRETLIDTLNLQGSYFSMNGSGEVDSGDLDDIPVTPMQVKLTLGSKPPLTEPLEILGLLSSKVDGNGYREWKQPIELSGTFSEPDAGELWDMLLGAVERAATMSQKDLDKEREKEGLEPVEKPKKQTTEEKIEQGVNGLLQLFGR